MYVRVYIKSRGFFNFNCTKRIREPLSNHWPSCEWSMLSKLSRSSMACLAFARNPIGSAVAIATAAGLNGLNRVKILPAEIHLSGFKMSLEAMTFSSFNAFGVALNSSIYGVMLKWVKIQLKGPVIFSFSIYVTMHRAYRKEKIITKLKVQYI